MRYLITGGCGFIGSNFIHYIIKKYPQCFVVNIDKLTYAGNKENLSSLETNPRYEFVKGDICDKKLVESLIKEGDIIVHFAAESHVDRSIIDSTDFIKTNVLGTQVLLDVSRKKNIKRFHHISTDEVYGELGNEGLFSENTPYAPRSPYSASKASSDFLVRSYYHTHGLPITISNCSNNYGPYQFPEKLIPLFITNLIDGKKIPLYGEGNNIRDWLHVKDHCVAIDLIIQKGVVGETYCIGGDCELKNKKVTKHLLNAFNMDESQIEHVQDRKGHDYRYAIDTTKIKKELGWKPKFNFETGIKETIEWYKKNEDWWRPLKNKTIKGITKKQ